MKIDSRLKIVEINKILKIQALPLQALLYQIFFLIRINGQSFARNLIKTLIGLMSLMTHFGKLWCAPSALISDQISSIRF